MSASGGSSSSGGAGGYGGGGSSGGENEYGVVIPDFAPPSLSDTKRGIAWFKLTFGFFYIVLGVLALARFFYVRNVFEIRARSPYLVMLNGVMLLSIIGAFAYNSENVLVGRFPVNLEHLFIVTYALAWGLFASFWARVLRLALAYSPRIRRKVPWLMSERMLVTLSILFALCGTILPWYRTRTTSGPFALLLLVQQNRKDRDVWSWALLGVSLLLVPVVWRVDDIFTISRELLCFVVIELMQNIATNLVEEYGTEASGDWINTENIPFVGALVLFGLIVVDPLRRLAFNPLTKTYPAFARAHAARREAALRALKTTSPSQQTEPNSFNDSGSASASEVNAARRRRWSYESLASVPEMAVAFRSFSFRALCQESVLFLEEVSKYQSGDYSASSPDDWGQWSAFSMIVTRFIADGSPDEINISHGDKRKILELSRGGSAAFEALEEHKKRTVFGESYVEIRYMLETNLLTRFLETQEFMDQEMTAPARRRHRRASSVHNGEEADMDMDGGMDDHDDGGPGVGGGVIDEEQPTPRRSRLEYPEMATL